MHENDWIHAQMNQSGQTGRCDDRAGAVTIDELQWYVVLAETEHMTEAATRLNVAQPTLSRSLARLERRLGTPLFDRANRRLRLNRYGAILLEQNDEWAVQRARYMTLETIGQMSDDPLISLPAVAS